MIDRLIYVLLALALLAVVMFDENFASNATHALGGLPNIVMEPPI